MTRGAAPPAAPDGRCRCWWCGTDPLYTRYHDTEWGRPVTDDTRLFEKICLEGFQAGLSWITILRKRESFRRAFRGFDMAAVAAFGQADIDALLKDDGIVRHRGKIESAINNARRALELTAEHGTLSTYIWSWLPEESERPPHFSPEQVKAMTKTATSIALSKDLKKRGWTFVGPTTIYAFMQAMGMVNDHVEGCFCRAEAEKERAAFFSARGTLSPAPASNALR